MKATPFFNSKSHFKNQTSWERLKDESLPLKNSAAFAFDGTNAHMNIGANVKPTFPFSISMRVLCTKYNEGYMPIFSSRGYKHGIHYYGVNLFIDSQGRLHSAIGGGDLYTSAYETVDPIISLKRWHNFIIVYNSIFDIEIYADGIPKDGVFGGSNTNSMSNGGGAGYLGTIAGSYFNGSLDEVRIYDRVLTKKDIEFLSGTVIELPEAPANLVAKEISSSQIELSWLRNTQNAYGYEISRLENSSSVFSAIDTLDIFTYTFIDEKLKHSTKYFYKIRALSAIENSDYSNLVYATTLTEGVPKASDVNYCHDGNAPVLVAEGENLRWYSDVGLTNLIHEGNQLTCPDSDPGAYYYYITQEYKGERSRPNTVKVTIRERPDMESVLSKNEIIPGEPVIIQVDGANEVYWFSDAEIPNNVGREIQVAPSKNTTFYAVGINGTSCEDTLAIPVLVQCNKCPNSKIVSAKEGTFNHGCYGSNYANDASCSWVIAPSGIEKIELRFDLDSFDIKAGDIVRVYNGINNSGTLLGEFDNVNKPLQKLTSGNKLYIELVSDETETGSGFVVNYVGLKPGENPPESIATNSFGQSIKLIPNPTLGELQITGIDILRDFTIGLYNIAGQKLSFERMDTDRINISHLPQGVYWLWVSYGEEYVVKKVIKE